MSAGGSVAIPWSGYGTGTDSQRIQAACDYLENNSGYAFRPGAASSLDPDVLELNVRALVELEDRYHVGNKNSASRREVKVVNSGGYIAACYSSSSQNIELNAKYYGNKRKLESVEADSSIPKSYYGDMPWHFINSGASQKTLMTYSVTHEYGHALQGKMWQKALFSGNTSQSFSQYAASCKRKIMSIAKKKYGNGSGADTNLSGYARKNSKEFFAEAFAGYNTGYVNPVTQAMGDWLSEQGY